MVDGPPAYAKEAAAWNHEAGEQEDVISCPRCNDHSRARYSHYLRRKTPRDGGRTTAMYLTSAAMHERKKKPNANAVSTVTITIL